MELSVYRDNIDSWDDPTRIDSQPTAIFTQWCADSKMYHSKSAAITSNLARSILVFILYCGPGVCVLLRVLLEFLSVGESNHMPFCHCYRSIQSRTSDAFQRAILDVVFDMT